MWTRQQRAILPTCLPFKGVLLASCDWSMEVIVIVQRRQHQPVGVLPWKHVHRFHLDKTWHSPGADNRILL